MEGYFPALAADFARLRTLLAGRPVAVLGHSRPDGDCIGSQVALARTFVALGHDVICVNSDPVPRRLQFLVEGTRFIGTDAALNLPAGRASVFVDCADEARGGERLKAHFRAPTGNIDHHRSNQGYAACNLVDHEAAATCEILAGILLDAALPIDARTAQALYAGILTDTGQFRFSATSRRCLQLAGALVGLGARPAVAGYELFERESLAKLRLLQTFLGSLQLECDGRVCIGTLPHGVLETTGATTEDIEGLVDYARCIEGVDIGVLIEERPHGAVKASLRSKEPAHRMDTLAAQFGGGGHVCAAGLNLKSGAADFYSRLVAALERRLAEVAAVNKN